MPSFNKADELAQCLAAIVVQETPAFEIIVADDASTEDNVAVAQSYGAKVVLLEGRNGAAATRNRGAKEARGDILLFIDADVVIPPDTVGRVAEFFRTEADTDALFGSYDADPQERDTVSQFRNLLHHYTHQIGAGEATTFWAGCGAIRREAFLSIGGFDADWEGIEDIELGYRLCEAGHSIRLDPTLQARHLKKWTIRSMITTDFASRGVPWARLILSRKKAPNDLNLRADQRASVALMGVTLTALATATIWQPAAIVAAAALGAVCVINRRFYLYVLALRGSVFCFTVILLHMLHFIVAGSAAACALSGLADKIRPIHMKP